MVFFSRHKERAILTPSRRDTLNTRVPIEEPQPESALLSLAEPVPQSAAMKPAAELTPFMRQWTAAKRENPDALLFFRMGDFYELFYDDAVIVSRELQLTLTARDRERSQPMCGVPYHAVEGYLTRLLRKGYRIAICDQMEDPKLTKKIVRREVTRVLSPGTALDAALGQEQNNFLAAYFETGEKKNSICAVALLDVSTGEFRTCEFQGLTARLQAIDEVLKAAPSELLLSTNAEMPAQFETIPSPTSVEDWVWRREFAVGWSSGNSMCIARWLRTDYSSHCCHCAGAVLHYVRTTQKNDALHIVR